MHVAAGRAVDDEPDTPAHVERDHANAAAHARIERLRGDLRPAEHDDSIDSFERNPLAALRRRHQQRPPVDAARELDDSERTPCSGNAFEYGAGSSTASPCSGVLVSSGRQ